MIDEKDTHMVTISKALRSEEEQVLCERKQRQSLQEKVRCSIFRCNLIVYTRVYKTEEYTNSESVVHYGGVMGMIRAVCGSGCGVVCGCGVCRFLIWKNRHTKWTSFTT